MSQPITDPWEWLRQQEQRIDEIQARAELAKEQLRDAAGTTLSSPSGAATVTVNQGGVLTDLQLSPRAEQLGYTALGAEILQTVRRAAAQAAQRTTQIMAGVVGEDSEAMDFLREQMPDQVEEDAPPAGPGPGPSAGPSQPAPPRPTRPAPRGDDDEDFGGGSVFNKDRW